MSHPLHPPSDDVLGLETGLQALEDSPTFPGPVEPIAEHESHDHLALIYESQAEQFATAIPYIAHGLERGERCVYIADENDTEAVITALREAETDVDVDAALESGALTMYTAQDSYLRNGAFDADDMIDFLSETITEAAAEYEGLRITGEMTWVFGDDPPLEELIEYEGKLNRLLPDADGIALCQYNRDRFPSELLRDIIKTHPHLVYDNTVCQNFYYTPPEEFFGPDQPDREIDRMMGTLLDRTEARTELQTHQQFLQRQNEITGDPDRSFEAKLQDLFDLGCERFDLEVGGLARIDPAADRADVELVSGDHEYFAADDEIPLSETFCAETIGADRPVAISVAHDSSYEASTLHREFGLNAYLGTHIEVEGDDDRTFFFFSSEPRAEAFSDDERTFHRLMAQWITYELEREQRDRHQRSLYEIAADPARSFDEKLQAMLALGRERFDLELGGLARIDPTTDSFEVEAISGEHDHLRPGAQAPLSETYCRATIGDEPTAEIVDPERSGFGSTLAYEEFGVKTYLGTRIPLATEADRTFFFVSTDRRDRAFSEAERTFYRLMTQWVTYELERKQRESALEESNDRLEQFAYAASHDLQEPLRMVTSYLQLLENRYGDQLDDDAEEFLAFAVDGAERMRDMIAGLLEYARVETRGDPFEPVDLDELLENVLTDLQVRIEETGAEITRETLPTVEGDGSQLRQVFQNLLSNAITYSGDSAPDIDISATRRGREWVVSVADAGIGIEPDDQERVFTVFDRLHSREEYDGTGIGLALCQRIVERHGGTIWVDSEPGEGSTFSISLPATA